MNAQQIAVYVALGYAVASGLSLIFTGLTKAFPKVSAFGSLATFFGTIAIDFQKFAGAPNAK